MPTFGEQLRDQRERREISLEEISKSTRIRRDYLAALERGDFDELPGDVFAKGYVRAYAEFIGADPEDLVEAFVDERRASGGAAEGPSGGRAYLEALSASTGAGSGRVASRRRKRGLLALGSIGAVSIVAVIGYAWWTERVPDAPRPLPDRSFEVAETPGPPAEARLPAARESRTPDDGADALATGAPAAPDRAGGTEPATGDADAATAPDATVDPEPVEPASATIPETPAPSTGRITVPESGVGTAIVDRRLEGQADRFPAGSRVHFWTRVIGAEPGERIRHVWIHEGRTVESIPLEIGASHWRTHSRKTLYATGPWAVEARDADGRVLARADFSCDPNDPR